MQIEMSNPIFWENGTVQILVQMWYKLRCPKVYG